MQRLSGKGKGLSAVVFEDERTQDSIFNEIYT